MVFPFIQKMLFKPKIRTLKGGGVHAPNFHKHDFEIMVDPKGSSNEATFWLSFEAPDP